MKRYISLISLVILTLTACQKEMDTIDENVMQFNMAYSSAVNQTKATATNFEKDDAVGLYVVEYDGEVARPLQISGNWVNNMRTVYDGTRWTPDKKIYWPESKVDVYGFFPFSEIISVDENPFKVALDQNTPAQTNQMSGYEASDFIWAKATAESKADQTVNLVYKHRMSHLIINLVKGESYEGGFPENAEIYIHNTVPSAIIDLATGTVMKAPFAKPETIKMRQISNEKYEAIIVPQRLMTSRPLVEYIANGVSYLCHSSFYFKPGKEHILNLKINSNPDQVSIEIGGQIGNWN